MASKSRVIYIGVTNNLSRRVCEHQTKFYPKSFSARYLCKHLVYYEDFQDVYKAIAREKELKAWKRSKKIALIETTNPFWDELQIL